MEILTGQLLDLKNWKTDRVIATGQGGMGNPGGARTRSRGINQMHVHDGENLYYLKSATPAAENS